MCRYVHARVCLQGARNRVAGGLRGGGHEIFRHIPVPFSCYKGETLSKLPRRIFGTWGHGGLRGGGHEIFRHTPFPISGYKGETLSKLPRRILDTWGPQGATSTPCGWVLLHAAKLIGKWYYLKSAYRACVEFTPDVSKMTKFGASMRQYLHFRRFGRQATRQLQKYVESPPGFAEQPRAPRLRWISP